MLIDQHTAEGCHLEELFRIAADEMHLCGIRGVNPSRVLDDLGADWSAPAFRRQVTAWCDDVKLFGLTPRTPVAV